MSIQFSLGKRLIRAAVSLGFLGCLIAAGTVHSQAATSKSSVVATKAAISAGVAMPASCGSRCANRNNCSDLMLTAQVEIGQPDEFGVAVEDDDSLEMLRVDIQHRAFGLDRELIGLKIAVTTARNIRPSISPPLLV
jgi:hypothetical protein